MRQKILTIDDSRTVRLLVKKAFKPFDCEIHEAANGVEGLAMAAEVRPDVILLDVTMPVMNGIEMLTKLKADSRLSSIPVVMLTAEGGRAVVLDIARLGVRSYIVKPFKEETMLDKVGRIIELKAADGPVKQRSVLDPIDILVVEDKPAIVQQIVQKLAHTPWKIRSAQQVVDALEACSTSVPDIILASLALADNAGFALFRMLRESPRTAKIPVFALTVKTDLAGQTQAQELGFAGIVTKPIDFAELETKAARAMNLDTSGRYFRQEGEFLTVALPKNFTSALLAEIGLFPGPRLADAVNSGVGSVLLDLQAVESLPMDAIKQIVGIIQQSRDLGMQIGLVAAPALVTVCQAFEETRGWSFHPSVEAAKQQLSPNSAASAA